MTAMAEQSPPIRIPRSAAHFGLCLVSLAGAVGTVWLMARLGIGITKGADAAGYLPVTMTACGVAAAILGAGELLWIRSYRNRSTGLAGKRLRAGDPVRILVRLLGLAATVGLVLLAYWAFPEYGSYYAPYWRFLRTLAIPVAVLAPLYFWWTDTRLEEPRDAYWHLGTLVLKWNFASADWGILGAHFKAWTVKGFFLGLMLVGLNIDVRILADNFHDGVGVRFMAGYNFLFNLCYTIDLLFCVVGYLFTLRLFDSHIRSTEPTAWGWLVAIMCYQPFWGAVTGQLYLHYEDGIFWDNWLPDWPALRFAWAGAILLLSFIYCLATVSFGLRFSNLTYRGIITSGPYRFSKHPAYISKNLSWWLIYVPWVSHHGGLESFRNCLLLGLNSLIYFLRARTEERHLSQDPDYVAYALWIEQHGLLRGLGRAFPFLRYRPPQVAAESPDFASVPAKGRPVEAG
jgi:protein-S-isoprenylcysteine O-methyltransferase Ste14